MRRAPDHHDIQWSLEDSLMIRRKMQEFRQAGSTKKERRQLTDGTLLRTKQKIIAMYESINGDTKDIQIEVLMMWRWCRWWSVVGVMGEEEANCLGATIKYLSRLPIFCCPLMSSFLPSLNSLMDFYVHVGGSEYEFCFPFTSHGEVGVWQGKGWKGYATYLSTNTIIMREQSKTCYYSSVPFRWELEGEGGQKDMVE